MRYLRVGFNTADRIARALGLLVDHPSLIEVGIVFALNETINEGHAYVPKKILKQRAIELLEISPDLIAAALEHRAQDDASCACYLLIRQPFEKFKQGFH